jgi:hypothetical protein
MACLPSSGCERRASKIDHAAAVYHILPVFPLCTDIRPAFDVVAECIRWPAGRFVHGGQGEPGA